MAGGSTRAIVAAFFANLGIAIAKFIGFLITRSSSMLAESIHSVADTSNQALLLWGGRAAGRPATPRHQFGHGRERYFWSFVVALVLFAAGSAFAVYEGIEKIRHPHEIDAPGVAIVILAVGILLEGRSFWIAIVESNRIRGEGTSWWGFVRRSRTPELPVVLLEDLGALLGLMLAMGAVIIATVADAPVWDGIGTLTIGILLGVIAIVLAIEMKSLLIGEGATAEDQAAILAALGSSGDVTEVLSCRTQYMGPDDVLVAARVHFRDGMSTSEVAAAIDAVEDRVAAAVPLATMIYIEPDLVPATAPPTGDTAPAEEGSEA